MADSTWFFSTIAQATAASIGFVIAFAAALYSTRRSRRHSLVREFQQDIKEFYDQTDGPLQEMENSLRSYGDFEPAAGLELFRAAGKGEAGEVSSIILEWAERQEDPVAAHLYGNIRWMHLLVRRLRSDSSIKQMEEMFFEMEKPLIMIGKTFDMRSEDFPYELPNSEDGLSQVVRLYREIRGSPETGYYEFDKEHGLSGQMPELHQYLSQHSTSSANPSTIQGWADAISTMSDSYYMIQNVQYFDNQLLDDNAIGPVLQTCLTLFLVGVLLPTLFLLTLPPSITPDLPIYLTTIAELVVLIATGYFGYKLFSYLIKMVEESQY